MKTPRQWLLSLMREAVRLELAPTHENAAMAVTVGNRVSQQVAALDARQYKQRTSEPVGVLRQ